MAVDTEVPIHMRKAREENLKRGVSSDEGREAFRRVLGSRLPQLVVCAKDLPSLLKATNAMPAAGMHRGGEQRPLDGERSAISPSSHARPELPTPYIDLSGELEVAVARVWQELFGLDRIGSEDDFFELGGDSLLAIQIASRLSKGFQVEVPVSGFFERPTVAGLAQLIEEALIAQIKGLSDGERERGVDVCSPTSGGEHV